MNRILYVLTNDGSDIRTVKEIQTLAKEYEVFFLGMGEDPAPISQQCAGYTLVKGKRNSISCIIKFVLSFINILFTKDIKVVHLVNENTVVYFYPLLFLKPVVLDLYDSLFLRYSKLDKSSFLKYMVYLPVNRIIVTDEARFDLMPEKLKYKCIIIPNVPHLNPDISFDKEPKENTITIAFTGALTKSRGSEILINLCRLYPDNVSVIMAGWINDDKTKELLSYKNVDYRGVLSQKEVYRFIIKECDYVLSVYSPHNRNNIYASPNKLFDAIHTKTPMIINGEVKVSDFVKNNNIGYIMESFDVTDYKAFFENLKANRNSYSFTDELIVKNSWEQYERMLLALHSF